MSDCDDLARVRGSRDMASGSVGGGLRHFSRLFSHGSGAGLTEGQLLERGVSRHDEAALSAVVERHGPMVLGVCRNLLQDPNDVDDAFQATFLVLVRRAESLRRHDQLGSWLYGVALKVAKRARGDTARRRSRLSTIEGDGPPGADDDRAESQAGRSELRGALLDEVSRLPESYRAAVVLCYLEGKSHEEAAQALGWPIGTVKGRLSRARDLLRDRLTRRGLTATSAAIAAALASTCEGAVPAGLVASTTSAAIGLAARSLVTKAGAALASTQALSLMEGALAAMYLTKLKLAATALAIAGVFATSAVVVHGQGAGSTGRPKADQKQSKTPSGKGAAKTDAEAAAPEGVASKIDVAKRGLAEMQARHAAGKASSSEVLVWSRRLVDAHLEADSPRDQKIAALDSYIDLLKKDFQKVKDEAGEGKASKLESIEAEYALAEAQGWLAKAKAAPEKAASDPNAMMMMGGMPGMMGRGMMGMGGGGFGGEGGQAPPHRRSLKSPTTHPSDEARNEVIAEKLEKVIPMRFKMETPLEDVLKYVKQTLLDDTGSDVPIYVDPVGLQEAEKTLASPIVIDLEGLPLRTTLRLLLNQLDLHYEIADGLLLISNGPEPAATGPAMGAGGFSGAGGFR